MGDCQTFLIQSTKLVYFYDHVFENHSEVFFGLGDIIFLETEKKEILVKVKQWFEKAKRDVPEQVNLHLNFFANQIDLHRKKRKMRPPRQELPLSGEGSEVGLFSIF